ncbi:MAG: hypothetical protein ACRDYU_13540 [Actinomycetes bacterium]
MTEEVRFPLLVELQIGGQWTDVTDLTYAREPIPISRGRRDEGGQVDPATCNLSFNNRDGRFSPRNPDGPWFGLLTRNTPVRVTVFPADEATALASDDFTRSVTDGWGTATSGHDWLTYTAAESERDVSSNVGTVTLTGDETQVRSQVLDGLVPTDVDVLAKVRASALATGAALLPGLVGRWTSPTRFARMSARLETTGAVGLEVAAAPGGVVGDVAETTVTYTGGSWLWLRARWIGDRVLGKVWSDGDVEPEAWGIDRTVTGTGYEAGAVGVLAHAETGNTNASPVLSYDEVAMASTAEPRRRFVGEVASWPQRWEPGEVDAWVPVEAGGILRRLQQNQPPPASPWKRATLAPGMAPPVAYWPMEDGSDSSRLSSALPNGSPMSIAGAPELASYDGFVASEPVVTLNATAILTANLPAYTPGTKTQVRLLARIPAAINVSKVLFRVICSGNARRWDVFYDELNNVAVRVFGPAGAQVDEETTTASLGDRDLVFALGMTQNGSDVSWSLTWVREDTGTTTTLSGTVTGRTVGVVERVSIAPVGGWVFGGTGLATGHLAVYADRPSVSILADALAAHQGETAARRVERILVEEGIPYTTVGDLDASPPMGPQPAGTPLEIMAAAADVDGGILHETRAELGLTYRAVSSLYNQGREFTP